MNKITLTNYKTDPYYQRIVAAVTAILAKEPVVAPVEVFVRMDLLRRENLENWRFGRIPYLEKVIHCNLAKASRILRILRFHAHDLNLVPSPTAYVKWGKGKRVPLRFSKTGDRHLEEAYSRHFVTQRLINEAAKKRKEGAKDNSIFEGDATKGVVRYPEGQGSVHQ
jgi:hypothetical protein